jgi:hypothetical protein
MKKNRRGQMINEFQWELLIPIRTGNVRKIYEFLKSNYPNAFTREEIAKEISKGNDISIEQTAYALNYLKKKLNCVENKTPYWRFKKELSSKQEGKDFPKDL